MNVADAETLFAEHRHQVFRYLCRAIGHAETARDLTQDVFVRVTGAPALPVHGELRAWLFHIARNLAIDHLRRQRHRPVDAWSDLGTRPSQLARVEVNDALRRIDAVDRDVFLMRELAGLSYDEIARACDLTADAVRSRIHRARVKLRDLLAPSLHDLRSGPMRQTGKTS